MMHFLEQKNSRVKSMKSSVIGIVVLGGVFAACTPEPARRSAVDSASRCSNNPERPVYQGNCLRTQAVQESEDTAGREPRKETPATVDSRPPVDSPAGMPPAGSRPAPAVKPAAGGGEPVTAPAPAAPPAASDPDAQKADAIEAITDAINKHGDEAVAGIEKAINGRGSGSGSSQTPPHKVYVVTFNKDSFIGIADGSVVRNCFVGSGSVIEVKGQPQKVTEFSSMGVNQYVTGESLEVNLMGGSTESCSLKGKDFVYIAGHATVTAKP